jgi:transmembrane sensor
MDNARLDFLFQRYINGSCTDDEARELMQFISKNDSPEIRRFLNHVWEHDSDKLPPEKADRIVGNILNISGGTASAGQKQKRLVWLKAAAAIVFTVLSGGLLYQFLFSEKEKLVAGQLAEAAQHQLIRLPDGSTVILNAGSALEYSDTFSDKKQRVVYLKGEAFFDIRHDATKPFIVRTEKISTTVLGTAFNVKAYPGQDNITVTVTRGKVSVSDDHKVLGIITPDQQITFHKASRQAAQQAVKSREVTAWAEKDIFFDDVSMRDAADQLAERFRVNISFENERAGNCRFTATFIRGEDLYQILDVICAFNQASYTTDAAGNISISGKGCTPQTDLY